MSSTYQQAVQHPTETHLQTAAILLEQLRRARTSQDVPYRPGPTTWPALSYERIAGLWPSTQSQHGEQSHSDRLMLHLNETIDSCVDYNFYCNAWILQNILDVQHDAPHIAGAFSDSDLAQTARALAENFRAPDDESSRMMFFWPKRVPAADGGTATTQYPTNITAKTRTILDTRAALRGRLTRLGLGGFIARHLPSLVSKRMERFFRIFRIPEDFDDSSLYVSIGARLRGAQDAYPNTARSWPTDTPQYAERLLRYAYRPFSDDASAATTDPRSYFWMRPFLRARVERAAQDGTAPSVLLPNTWVQSIDEACAAGDSGYSMPLACNSVDVTICANVLHALATEILETPGPWCTAEVEQLFGDTAELVAWVIETETVNARGDLALTFYPDLETFYWFAARVVGLLRDPANARRLPPVLDQAREQLQRSMRIATLHLIDRATHDSAGVAWWQGVLGGDADRVYMTAVAANALLEAWTYGDAHGARFFHDDTPPRVAGLLDAAVAFLGEHSTSGRYPLRNAFFCASAKSEETHVLRYPVNFMAYTDGRAIDPVHTPIAEFRDESYTLGVRGYIDDERYLRMLEEYQDGMRPAIGRRPLTKLIYWCSENVTRSICAVALVRYAELKRPKL